MVKISGINIAAPVVPFTTDDVYPTHDSTYGKGGWRSVDTVSELNAIPEPRKKNGMAVYVNENDTTYILKNNVWQPLIMKAVSQTFTFHQAVASNRWEIQHNLNKFPSATVVDSAGTEVIGDLQYVDSNNIIIEFSSSFTGTAYLN